MKFLNFKLIAALFAGLMMSFGVAAAEHPGSAAGADAGADVDAGASVDTHGAEHPGDDADDEDNSDGSDDDSAGSEHPGTGK